MKRSVIEVGRRHLANDPEYPHLQTRWGASRLQTDGTTVFRVEDESVVTLAIDAYLAGLDFTDALHHASTHGCERFLTFDDRGFARPIGRLKLRPIVMVPAR